jgi:hypothetical protein
MAAAQLATSISASEHFGLLPIARGEQRGAMSRRRMDQAMGFRFRKRIGLFGGMVHVNLSKTGISLSAGPRDANINVDLSGRRKHPRASVGIPGSGLTYLTDLGVERQQPQPPELVAPVEPGSKVLRVLVMLIIVFGICLLVLAGK